MDQTNERPIDGPAKAWRRGFTVAEMLLVIVIIGIVARISMPALSYKRFRADGAGRIARTLLQEAQRNAITRQSNVIVSFDLVDNRYRIVQDYNNNDTINTNDWVQWRNLPEHAVFAKPNWVGAVGEDGTTPGSGINGTQLQTVSGLSSVIFRRDGSSSSDLEIFVTTNVNTPTEYREIYVTMGTGQSALYKYTGKPTYNSQPTFHGWVRMTQ